MDLYVYLFYNLPHCSFSAFSNLSHYMKLWVFPLKGARPCQLGLDNILLVLIYGANSKASISCQWWSIWAGACWTKKVVTGWSASLASSCLLLCPRLSLLSTASPLHSEGAVSAAQLLHRNSSITQRFLPDRPAATHTSHTVSLKAHRQAARRSEQSGKSGALHPVRQASQF